MTPPTDGSPVVDVPVEWRTPEDEPRMYFEPDAWRDTPMTDAEFEEKYQEVLLELQKIMRSDQIPKQKERDAKELLTQKYRTARMPQVRRFGRLISWTETWGLIIGEDRRMHTIQLEYLEVRA